jgi:hypothetical protein
MPLQTLHVHLSDEAGANLDGSTRQNRAGQTLRDWLIQSFYEMGIVTDSTPTLFGVSIEVEREVPALLEALSRITFRTPDELVESWLMEPQREGVQNVKRDIPSAAETAVLSEETLGKAAYILDLGETLAEEALADARRRLDNSYPEGEQAAKALSEVFSALRELLGLE